MNKTRMFILLLLTIFCSTGIAIENSETEQVQSAVSNIYLIVNEVRHNGRILVLNDGSEWNIKAVSFPWIFAGWGWTEQSNVAHWAAGDMIEIQYPGSGNFFDFCLLTINLSKNESALVTLKQAPSVDQPGCLWIADYDHETSRITLNDGSVWLRSHTDLYGAFFHQEFHSPYIWQTGDVLSLINIEGLLYYGDFLLWNHATNEMPNVKRLK